jgi:hypothetical protein
MLDCIVVSVNRSSTSPYIDIHLFPIIIPTSLIVNKNLHTNQIRILGGHRNSK